MEATEDPQLLKAVGDGKALGAAITEEHLEPQGVVRAASRAFAFEAADIVAPLEPLRPLRHENVVAAVRRAARAASRRVAFEAADLGAPPVPLLAPPEPLRARDEPPDLCSCAAGQPYISDTVCEAHH